MFFVYAGASKLRQISEFSLHVADFGIVPDGIVVPVAWAFCLLELACGIGTLANVRAALYGVAGLLTIFVLVLAYGMVLGLDVQCGCLGSGYSMNLQSQLLVDCGLLVLCYLVHRSWEPCRSKSST